MACRVGSKSLQPEPFRSESGIILADQHIDLKEVGQYAHFQQRLFFLEEECVGRNVQMLSDLRPKQLV